MDKVEFLDLAKLSPKEVGQALLRQRHLEGGQCVNRETRVIKIRITVPVAETAVGMCLAHHKIADQPGSFLPENRRGQAGDL